MATKKRHYRPEPVATYTRCVCGKLSIPSVRAARQAIRQEAVKGHARFSYRCPETGALHLTSRPSWDSRRGEK